MHTHNQTLQMFDASLETFTGDLLVYLVEEDVFHVADANEYILRLLTQICETGDFKGKKEESFLFYPGLSDGAEKRGVQAKRLLFVGLGKQSDQVNVRREQLRLAGGTIAKQAGTVKAKEVLVVLPKDYLLDAVEIAECVSEGLLLGNYRFDLYKNPKEGEDAPARVERFVL